MPDLFADQGIPSKPPEAPAADAPLADRLRPRSLDEVVGQEHLTGPDGAIGRMVAAGKLASMILWGPPGTGKTTIARLLADAVGMRFVAISAVFSGGADLTKLFAAAREAVDLDHEQQGAMASPSGATRFSEQLFQFCHTREDGGNGDE